MAPPMSVALLALTASVALAVVCGLAALGTHPGRPGWGGDVDSRLERLASPTWRRRASGAKPTQGGGEDAGERPEQAPGAALVGLLAPAAVGALAAWVLSGRGAMVLAGALGLGWLAATRRGRWRAAARRRFAAGLEEALESMVASLRAGRGLTQAVEDAADHSAEPVRSALRDVVIAVRAGQPLTTALAEMARTWPIPEVTYLRACLDTHSLTGGDVTALLLNLGGVLRERRHLSRELGGKTAEARSTAVLLALLPPGLLLYILWVEPGQLAPLLAASFGVAAALYSGISWLAGVMIIRKMLADVERAIEEEG